jgi:alkylation response protein AidB-like acyl-CoA dehydrogenase
LYRVVREHLESFLAYAECGRQRGLSLDSPGKPLGTRQTVQEWIAESRAEIHAARLMVLHAAHKIDREGTYAAREEISIIKFYVAGVLQRVLDRAIQVHGALGLTDATPLAAWYRHERAARIYDGPDESTRPSSPNASFAPTAST